MSYEIYLGDDEVVNYTSNVKAILDWADHHVGGDGNWRAHLDGLYVQDGVSYLIDIVEELAMFPHKYEPLQPENGWGDLRSLTFALLSCVRAGATSVRLTPQWRVFS